MDGTQNRAAQNERPNTPAGCNKCLFIRQISQFCDVLMGNNSIVYYPSTTVKIFYCETSAVWTRRGPRFADRGRVCVGKENANAMGAVAADEEANGAERDRRRGRAPPCLAKDCAHRAGGKGAAIRQPKTVGPGRGASGSCRIPSRAASQRSASPLRPSHRLHKVSFLADIAGD